MRAYLSTGKKFDYHMFEISEVYFIHHDRSSAGGRTVLLLRGTIFLRQTFCIEALGPLKRPVTGVLRTPIRCTAAIPGLCLIAKTLLTFQFLLERFLHIDKSLV